MGYMEERNEVQEKIRTLARQCTSGRELQQKVDKEMPGVVVSICYGMGETQFFGIANSAEFYDPIIF